ncbi:glycosyltransferase [Sphingomonas sp. LH128]|uniref:glycosyltransferase n=1 Tax=Sphingomonas sp. LH128 TaxID=473781 RepID=UPI000A077655|nr:glycosyltransferase [Sphingomonas sp. LH128]
MVGVSVIYHHFPHYRAPIVRELSINGRNNYNFWGSLDEVEGIKPFRGEADVCIQPLGFRRWGRFWLLSGYSRPLFDKSNKVIIVLANPNMPATIAIALLGRFLGKKVIFWAHGWLKKHPAKISRLRNLYFSLADCVLVYGERAARIAYDEGFAKDKVHPIYNSLDFEQAQLSLAKIESTTQLSSRPQNLFVESDRPLLICTARLTTLCQFDILFHAARQLADCSRPVNILLIGDGPEREALENLSSELGITVCFYGSCYDEDEIARLIYWSDITVSPGKIGLTAVHSLTYGTPAITHGDFDAQMPEVEAIKPGVSGAFFERNNATDLARTISEWLNRDVDRCVTREACQAIIAEKWNPANQRKLIEDVIENLIGTVS